MVSLPQGIRTSLSSFVKGKKLSENYLVLVIALPPPSSVLVYLFL